MGFYSNRAPFPHTRLRRLRQSGYLRELVQEHQLTCQDLIYPVFILDGKQQREHIASMPGIERLSIDLLLETLKPLCDLGLRAIALFPVTPAKLKTADGKEAYNPNGLVQNAIRSVKQQFPELLILAVYCITLPVCANDTIRFGFSDSKMR